MRRAILVSLAAAVVGIAVIGIGFVIQTRQALFSYLAAYVFALGIALGGLVLSMIGQAAGATWFILVRRICEAMAATLPLFVVLFVPIALGTAKIYPWAAETPEIEARRIWYAAPFFFARAAVYFSVWIATAILLRRWSVKGDVSPSPKLDHRRRALAGAAFPAIGLTVTFAAIDWIMSLDGVWYSNVYGFYFFAGGFVASLAIVVIAANAARAAGVVRGLGPEHFHALGKLLFAFVIFWAYIAYSQLVVIWMADIPRESSWYLVRTRGSWSIAAIALAIAQFVVPFFVLLSRELKRRPTLLAAVAAWVVVAHLLDVYWLVLPALHTAGARPSIFDLAALLAVCGPLTAFALTRYRAVAPVPLHDPELPEALRYEAS